MDIKSLAFTFLAYFLGSIPFGVIVSRFAAKTDIRAHGSGNIGATNVSRVVGKKWGILVLVLDAFKGWIAVSLALHLGSMGAANAAAVAALIGHCFSAFLNFKGGKGVATALGVGLALTPPLVGLSAIGFFIGLFSSRRVSVGSLIGSLVYGLAPVSLGIRCPSLRGHFSPIAAFAIMALVIFQHRTNIQRLISGQEPRFF